MIYLDHNSTTPLDPVVLEAMMPYFKEHFGNAGSTTHALGWHAREAVDIAREQVAGLINCNPSEIIFTSGATESINLALQGAFRQYSSEGNHIITTKTEHKAVLDTCSYLESMGAEVTYLPVEPSGLINTDDLVAAIRQDTIMVCIMHANNETGVIQDMKAILKIANKNKVLLMSDMTQSCGKLSINVHKHGVDMICLSAHKMYGPKGIGALFISGKNPEVKLQPIIHGGGHEKGLRVGTLNVPAIVGFGKACEIATGELVQDVQRIKMLRDQLEVGLLELGGIHINGDKSLRLYNTSNLSIDKVEAIMLIETVNKEIAVSTGSACTSANPGPSHVLKAMGFSKERIHSSVRFSLGKFTSAEDIQKVVELISENVKALRASSTL